MQLFSSMMVLGISGALCIFALSLIRALKQRQLSRLLDILICGVSDNDPHSRITYWGYMLSWTLFLVGFLCSLFAT